MNQLSNALAMAVVAHAPAPPFRTASDRVCPQLTFRRRAWIVFYKDQASGLIPAYYWQRPWCPMDNPTSELTLWAFRVIRAWIIDNRYSRVIVPWYALGR